MKRLGIDHGIGNHALIEACQLAIMRKGKR